MTYTSKDRTPPIAPCLGDLVFDRELAPAEARHSRFDAVAIVGLLHPTHVNVQRPQHLGHLQGELAEAVWDLVRLGDPLLALALLAGVGGNLCLGNPTAVDRLQGARLQRVAGAADAPGPELAPVLHKGRAVARAGGRQACVIRGDVRGLGHRQLVVHEELLRHALPVGRPALLVGRHLRAAQCLESPLAVLQDRRSTARPPSPPV